MLTVACTYMMYMLYLQCAAILPIPLSRALELVQRHPRVHLANLDLHSKAVASAVKASDLQCDKWCDLSPSDVVK